MPGLVPSSGPPLLGRGAPMELGVETGGVRGSPPSWHLACARFGGRFGGWWSKGLMAAKTPSAPTPAWMQPAPAQAQSAQGLAPEPAIAPAATAPAAAPTTANWAQAQSSFFYSQPAWLLLTSEGPTTDRCRRGNNCHDGRDHGPDVTGMPTRDFWVICTCLVRLMCCRPPCLLLSAPNCHNSRLLQRIAIASRLFCAHVFCARSLQTLSIATPPLWGC